MKYPQEAAYWLRPLLDRYFGKRSSGCDSEYLFVRQYRRTRNNMPVDHRYIYELVQRASLRVLNGRVNPRDLRGTAAVIRADRSKRCGAILTKLGYTSRRATRFNYLETFRLEPKPLNSASPQRGRSVVSSARRAERASEAGARGRTNKVAGVFITAIPFGSAATRCSWENGIFCYQMTVRVEMFCVIRGQSQIFFALSPYNISTVVMGPPYQWF